MANAELPTNVTEGYPDLPGLLNVTHGEVNELSRATGLRDVTSLLANGWTATGVRIERVRDLVYFYWRGLDGSAATSRVFLTFGSGATDISNRFASMDGSYQTELHQDDAGGSYRFRVIAANMQVPSSADLRELGGYWKMACWRAPSTAWPSTLPGTAV